MIIKTIKLSEMSVFTEFFLGISIMYLVMHGLFVSFNRRNNFPLIQSSLINLGVLTLIMSCLLIYNDSLNILKYTSFCNSIVNDSLSVFARLSIGFSSIICLLLMKQYLISQRINSFEYIILILFSILGLFLLCSSNDFITAYLAIELQSLSFYVLASFKKNSAYSVESGLKYFILGAFSSGLFLFGSSLIYGAVGTLNFSELHDLILPCYNIDSIMVYNIEFKKIIQHDPNIFDTIAGRDLFYTLMDFGEACGTFVRLNHALEFNNVYGDIESFTTIGVMFIFVSLFFKLALTPFHLWSPDIYENSPTSSGFFFAVVPKIGIFVVLLRLSYYALSTLTPWWQEIFLLVSIASVMIGSLGGLEQKKFKSLLAYSSISHMGYSLISFSAASTEGFQMLFCYLIVYMFSGLCLWSAFILIRLKKLDNKKQNKDLADFMLLKKSNFMLATIIITALFSIAGLPPLVGFLVKLNVFLIAIQNSMWFLAIFSILFSVISTFYYLRIIKIMYFEPVLVGKLYYPIKSMNVVILALFFYLFLFLFINPSMLYLTSYKFILLFFG